MSAEQAERKLRDLVETAGFELAIDLDHPGRFRILTKEFVAVGAAAVTARGFDAVFPQRARVSMPTDLVDVLEAIKVEVEER